MYKLATPLTDIPVQNFQVNDKDKTSTLAEGAWKSTWQSHFATRDKVLYGNDHFSGIFQCSIVKPYHYRDFPYYANARFFYPIALSHKTSIGDC